MSDFATEWQSELGAETTEPRKRAGYALPLILGRRQVRNAIGGSLALRTIYATGLRETELKGLLPADIGERSLRVAGRLVPVDAETAQALRDGPLDDAQDALAGCPELVEIFRSCERVLEPSALRHAFAVHRLEAGMDLVALHNILGNENAPTTLQYLQCAAGLRAGDYARAHPLMEGPAGVLAPCSGELGGVRGEASSEEPGGEDPSDGDETVPSGLATPTFEEVQQIWGHAGPVMRVYYATGLRRNELLALRPGDLHRDEGRIFVRGGKEDKDRYVLVDPGTMALIPQGDPPFDLTQRRVDELFHRAVQETGIWARYEALGLTVTLHCLRRAFATHCYLRGMKLTTLKRLMGHGQLTTTALYLQVPFEHCAAGVPGW